MNKRIHIRLGFFLALLLISFIAQGQEVDHHTSYQQILQIEKTEDRRNQLIELSNRLSERDTSLINEVLFEIGKTHLVDGREKEALKSFLEVKPFYDLQGETYKSGFLHYNIGLVYFTQNLSEEALPYFVEADKLIGQHNDQSSEYYEVVKTLADCYARLNDTESAFDQYTRLIRYYENDGNIRLQLNTLQDIVRLFYDADDYQEALTYNLQLQRLVEANPEVDRISTIYNNLGYNYNFLKEYEKGINYFKRSLSLVEDDDAITQSQILTNIAVAYNNLGQLEKSIAYYSRALKLLPEDNYREKANIYHLLANTFLQNKEYNSALSYVQQSIAICQKNRLSQLLAESNYTAASIKIQMSKYKEAIAYFEDYLSIRDSINHEENLIKQGLLQEKLVLERTEKEMELLLVDNELRKIEIDRLSLKNSNLELEKEAIELNAAKKEQELELLLQNKKLQEEKIRNQELATARDRQRLELAENAILDAQRQSQLLSLESEKKEQALQLLQQDKLIEQERQKAEVLEQQSKIDQLEIESQRAFQRNIKIFIALGALFLLTLLGGLLYMLNTNKKLNEQNIKIEKQKEAISLEQEKSDLLLYNILPVSTAQELKEHGAATPKQYENVSVLFTDFSGFTTVASNMTPEEIIRELDECFLVFDEIVEKHNLEKIKTIGDAYMCAGGIPIENVNNAVDCVKAGIEMQHYMEQLYQRKTTQGVAYWRMRVGIHSGPLVAGVVGKKKFSYDIWGDTVNVASRMESNGEIGKINISEDTYQQVKDHYQCQYRGEYNVKSKGNMRMYFVET